MQHKFSISGRIKKKNEGSVENETNKWDREKKPEQEDQTESPNKQLAPRKMHPLL